MTKKVRKRKRPAVTLEIDGHRIKPGQRRDLKLVVSQSYSGLPVMVPMRVWRAEAPGPVVGVTGAVHGDELNGMGIVRQLMLEPGFDLIAGTLILVPVVNILGLDRHMRYLPDRRDLNRSFPGSAGGSLASRFARAIFRHIVHKCDYLIDFHTAAVRRTNFPNIRADLSRPDVERLADAFGAELIVSGKGPDGSLRRAACDYGCPTIILEAGEVWKTEPSVVQLGQRGVRNVLIELGMVKGKRRLPAYQARVEKTEWVRANAGGMLQFHIAPGQLVMAGDALATNSDIMGRELNVLTAPTDGIVLGMTTLPMVTPGDPVVHLAFPIGGIETIRRRLDESSGTLHSRIRHDLATSVTITDVEENSEDSGSAG